MWTLQHTHNLWRCCSRLLMPLWAASVASTCTCIGHWCAPLHCVLSTCFAVRFTPSFVFDLRTDGVVPSSMTVTFAAGVVGALVKRMTVKMDRAWGDSGGMPCLAAHTYIISVGWASVGPMSCCHVASRDVLYSGHWAIKKTSCGRHASVGHWKGCDVRVGVWVITHCYNGC